MQNLIILIPHYNNINELKESIKSIQEEIPVDILIVDDGSTDKPILQNLQTIYKYGKVFIEYLDKNVGIENALNAGLSYIDGKGYEYIGRLDCGDINRPNKYKKQLEYLEKNPETFLLGTWADMVDTKGNFLYTLKHPTADKEIKNKMYLNSMFVHPTVIFRKEVLQIIGNYPTKYKAAEDYAFFFEISKKLKVENLPEALLIYKIDPNSISSTKRKIQVKNRIKVIWKHFYLGYFPIYGLVRNVLLLFMSRKMTTFMKKRIK
ncbi:MAG: glycosyl transferase family 2 [Aequorivita sp.]|nr:glycosyl transferase family 2 [Aequorivita sp.]|tara:strand:- start:59810 stop:60598 length:789 start_codon:yes stop_codon:yes gene_type:complete